MTAHQDAREEQQMSNESETQISAEDIATVTIAGDITTPSGMHLGTIIDPALWAAGPRYRIHLGLLSVWPLATETTRGQAAAMARGLRDTGPHHVRLVEITETATEIQLDEETAR